MLTGTARQWINDLAANSIKTWFDMQTAFTKNFQGTYKRPHNIGDLQRCRRADDETSQTFLARWLDMKKSCEGVTDESTILAFIDSLERGQLLRHRLLQERTEGKLTLNSMITITSNYAAADDDARESLKASVIQNTGKRNNSNKRKNPPEEQQAPDMVATTFADKGQSSQRGRGRGTSSGQPQSSATLASAPSAPMSYDEYRDMPCFAHRNALGKCNHTNQNCKFVNNLKADQEAGFKRSRRQRPRGKGKADKDKESRDGSDIDEDPVPKPAKKAEEDAGKANPIKNKKGAFHTFLGPPTAKAQRAAMHSLNTTVPKIRQYVRWSEIPVHWSHDDHPEHIPEGYNAMVVCPVIHGYEFSKYLMDGGSSLNIMYVETLTKLGLTKTQLRHSAVAFYGVVPSRQAKSLGSITLKVAFGSEENYREEPLTFEVVPFKSTYHVIFGRPAFHSFHARPCYIYNQLKMPGPDGIITVYGSFRKAKECKDGEATFAEAVFFGEELKEIHAATDPTEMPASKQEIFASPPTFKPIVDTNQVELVAGNAAKTTSIGTNLSTK
jgi:hypothetical protein